MTRSNAREVALHLLFEAAFQGEAPDLIIERHMEPDYYKALEESLELYSERPNAKQQAYINGVVCGVSEKLNELDQVIAEYSVGWDLSRISLISKCIMRLAIYEILYVEDVPQRVAVNEAVELAKKYDDESAVRFINGILGSYTRALNVKPADAEKKD